MKASAYLPVWVYHVPASQVFTMRGDLLPSVKHYADQGVVCIVAGATACHLCIDVQRPYFRPDQMIQSPVVELGGAA